MRRKISLSTMALFLFAMLFSFSGASATESGATTLTPTAAFYVSGWSGDVDKNMSGNDYIMVSTSSNDPKKAYIEFEIPAQTVGFDSATLTLFHREASNSSLKTGVGYEFRLCETNGYDVDTITWNNASGSITALSDIIGSGVVSDEDVASGSITIELAPEVFTNNTESAKTVLIEMSAQGKMTRTFWTKTPQLVLGTSGDAPSEPSEPTSDPSGTGKIDMAGLIESGAVKLIDGNDTRDESETLKQTMYLFDDDPATNSDFRYSNNGATSNTNGSVIFDFGAEYAVKLSQVRVMARQDRYYTRAEGIRLQGTNVLPADSISPDGWSGKDITAAFVRDDNYEGVWQELSVTDDTAYRYIRFANDTRDWYGNAAGLELYGEIVTVDLDTYNITYPEVEGGVITGSSEVKETLEVALDVKAEPEYKLKDGSLKYIYNGKEYEIVDNTFVMPSRDVTITAEFEKIASDDEGFIRLNRDMFSVSANSSNSGHPASYAIDGDLNTLWHSDWTGGRPDNFSKDGAIDGEKPPYMLTIDLGKVVDGVSRFVYTPRIYSSSNVSTMNGIVTEYEIYVSQDNINWTEAARGEWLYDENAPDSAERYASFDPVSARYVRLAARDCLHSTGGYAASAAEVNIEKSEKDKVVDKTKLDSIDLTIIEDQSFRSYIERTISEYRGDELVTAEAIDELCNLASYYTQSIDWIDRDLNPNFIRRLNESVVENEFSNTALYRYLNEISGSNALGKDLDENIIRDMGPEYTMSEEEKEQPLIERMNSAIESAKARIDANPTEDYTMLKELISYMTAGDDPKYTDLRHEYGSDADTCEYIVTNINFTLDNLEEMDAGGLSAVHDTYSSGDVWLDKYGSKISAGGGSIIKVGDTYYWYGEDNKIAYSLRTGVSCYSSKDLKTWTYEGLAFNAFDRETNSDFTDEFLTDHIVGTQGRIERPKVIYNEKTGKYVMWMHLEKDGVYTLSMAGVAVADSPTGPFEWKWYGCPVLDPYVTYNEKIFQTFRDMNLFVDDDGEAYVIYASEGNQVTYAVRLNDEYTWIDTEGLNTADPDEIDYNELGMYATGTLYDYNSDGTGYVDTTENSYLTASSSGTGEAYEPTEEDLKTLIYFDTTQAGPNGFNETVSNKNYRLPSYTRYQLASGEAIASSIKNNRTVTGDGLMRIPTHPDNGRWAKIGQYSDICSTQLEAPALIKADGVYYMICSGISGWKANAGKSLKTGDLLGRWTDCGNPFTGNGPETIDPEWTEGWDASAKYSFNSQSTCIFSVQNEEGEASYYYMGDRWKNSDYWDDGHLGVKKSTYVWLPIVFERDTTDASPNLKVYWTDSFSFPEIDVQFSDEIISFDPNGIKVSVSEPGRTLYVADYDENGILRNIAIETPESAGEYTYQDFGFEADKAFLWTNDMLPLDYAE